MALWTARYTPHKEAPSLVNKQNSSPNIYPKTIAKTQDFVNQRKINQFKNNFKKVFISVCTLNIAQNGTLLSKSVHHCRFFYF